MKNKRHCTCLLLNSIKSLKGETGPICRILTVDITDTCSKHGNTEIGNHLALCGICALTCANNAILFATDRANLSLKRDSLFVTESNKLLSLFDVFLNGVVRTVEHYGREACLDTLKCALVRAVVKVESYGNGDAKTLDHTLNHTNDSLVAAHILACTLGYTENNGRVHLLRGEKNSLGPLKVVDIELANCIVAFFCFSKHFLCRN